MSSKVCTRCKEKKPHMCFKKVKTASGREYYRNVCELCNQDNTYKYRQNLKHKEISDLLSLWRA